MEFQLLFEVLLEQADILHMIARTNCPQAPLDCTHHIFGYFCSYFILYSLFFEIMYFLKNKDCLDYFKLYQYQKQSSINNVNAKEIKVEPLSKIFKDNHKVEQKMQKQQQFNLRQPEYQNETSYPYFANQKINQTSNKLKQYLPFQTEQASNFKQKRNRLQGNHNQHYRKSLQKRLERLFKEQKDMIQQRYSLRTNQQKQLKGKSGKPEKLQYIDTDLNPILSPNIPDMSVQRMQMKIKLLEEKYRHLKLQKGNEGDDKQAEPRQKQAKTFTKIKNRRSRCGSIDEDNEGFSFQIPKSLQKKTIISLEKNFNQKPHKNANTSNLKKQVKQLKTQFQQVKDFYEYLYVKNEQKQKKHKKTNQCKVLLNQISAKLEVIKNKIKLKDKVERAQEYIESLSKEEVSISRRKADKKLLYEIQELNSRLKNEFRKRQQAEEKAKWALSRLDELAKPSQLPLKTHQ